MLFCVKQLFFKHIENQCANIEKATKVTGKHNQKRFFNMKKQIIHHIEKGKEKFSI